MALRWVGDLFRAFPDSNQKAAETDPINEGETIQKFMDAVLQLEVYFYSCLWSENKKNGADAHEVCLFWASY